MFRFGAVALFAALSILPASAQTLPGDDELRAHITYLASDELAGRRPGTEGERLSANYIAAAFAEIGLEPVFDGGYFQPVELVERRLGDIALSWSGSGESARLDSDDAVGLGLTVLEQIEDAPVLFVGFGREIDQSGLDFEGAAVLLLAGQPGVGSAVPSFAERTAALARRGAAAVFAVSSDEADWQGAQWAVRYGQTVRASEPMARIEGMLSPDAAQEMLGEAGFDVDEIGRIAADAEFRPVRLDLTLSGRISTGVYPFAGSNVAARLPGSGGGDEAVLLLAHHDHLGICRGEQAPDRICNGAVDNASGVAALIEAARHLAEGPTPHRDIYFLATTAEELGLLGARAFADYPPVPLSDIVAALNLDTVATSPAGSPIVTVGRGMTPIDPVIERVAASLGRQVDRGTGLNAFVGRQDGKVLFDAGVPSVMIGGIDPESFERFLTGPYHTPEDEAGDDLDLSGLREDVVFQLALVRALADPEQYNRPPR